MKLTQRLIPFLLATLPSILFAVEDRPIQSFSYPFPEFGEVERLSPKLDAILPNSAKMHKLAEGFDWSEGPAWDFANEKLLFSDIPENIVFQWKPNLGVSIFLVPSGFTGESYNGREPGSNGLTFDLDGHLHLAQHGDRRVARLNPGRRGFATIAARYDNKRFNSPNDLCFDSQGNLYFTDPPYGLAPESIRELDDCGVYRVSHDGKITLLSTELERPNGIALSPDEKTLYVANSHGPRPIIMAFPILGDGTLGEGVVLFDSTELRAKGRRGGNDGLKADIHGNLWATGPGGVLILSPEGEHLGSLLTGRNTANCAFGGNDGSVLYITADDTLCRIQTSTTGYFPSN
ncbi:SMP-30/Gluconolaconase/LRE-like region superfamily [Verrucomicrobiia bacterium DG1235]|nr:SMP-30/Gluconolaconase/LRE-like region superfamily [Verrucomicrobiae bacterium DG1235]